MGYEKAAEETAKAVQTLAPLADKHAERLEGFLHKVIGEGLTHLGGAFADWAASFRYKNALRLMHKVEEIHRKRGVVGRTVPIPPRLGIPLLQKATLEDDSTLAAMWAALTANALDPNRHVEARRGFTELLGSLEPVDAMILQEIQGYELLHPDRLSRLGTFYDEKAAREYWPNVLSLAAKLGLSVETTAMAVENLERLALVYDRPLGDFAIMTHPTSDRATLDLTNTGRALLIACRL
jgi:hypothetical protein